MEVVGLEIFLAGQPFILVLKDSATKDDFT